MAQNLTSFSFETSFEPILFAFWTNLSISQTWSDSDLIHKLEVKPQFIVKIGYNKESQNLYLASHLGSCLDNYLISPIVFKEKHGKSIKIALKSRFHNSL